MDKFVRETWLADSFAGKLDASNGAGAFDEGVGCALLKVRLTCVG